MVFVHCFLFVEKKTKIITNKTKEINYVTKYFFLETKILCRLARNDITFLLNWPVHLSRNSLEIQWEFFDQLWKPSSVRICSKQDTIRFTRVKKLEDRCCRLEKRFEVRFYNSNEIRNPFGRKGKRREENPWNLFAMFNQANEMRVSHWKLIFISNAVANAEEWHYSGVKMIANISRISCFNIQATSMHANSSEGSIRGRRSIDFAFLLASRFTENEIADGWFIYSLRMIEYPPIIGFNRWRGCVLIVIIVCFINL